MVETLEEEKEFKIEDIFESAVAIVKNLPKDGPIKPSNDIKLKFYAYYKQATHGPNDTSKPSFLLSPTNWYKWDAWSKLASMSKEEAMKNYISCLRESMESLPGDPDPTDLATFENALGKKFYDYWFKSWVKKEMTNSNTGDTIKSESEDDDCYVMPASSPLPSEQLSSSNMEHSSLAFEISTQFRSALIKLHKKLVQYDTSHR